MRIQEYIPCESFLKCFRSRGNAAGPSKSFLAPEVCPSIREVSHVNLVYYMMTDVVENGDPS